MDSLSAIALGTVQGLTEFLPISSTGHLILARSLFTLPTEHGLAIDAFFHLATAFAVLVYFRQDIVRLIRNLFMSPARGDKKDQFLTLALIFGTIPAIVIGLTLETEINSLFRSPQIVAYGLIAGSVVFVTAEFFYKWYEKRTHREGVLPRHGFTIGLFQALALVPGMSRSGMTISGGMLLGYAREEATRFAFLLSFPVILGAGILKVRELVGVGVFETEAVPLFLGALAAFFSALWAIHFMVSFLKKHSLLWFAGYRVLLAVCVLLTL